MNENFNYYDWKPKEDFKRKKPEERKYPKKDWPIGYEPTEKEFEEWMEEGTGIPVSFHWEDGKKRGVFTPIKKNMEILTDFEKALGNGQPVNFQIKGSDGELRKVSKEEFAEWMTEGKEEKNIETPPKESLIYGASGDIDGITVFMEKRGKDGFIKESYYQPRSEEEKQQIIERNRRRQEEEKSQEKNSFVKQETTDKENKKIQIETSPNSDKKEEKPATNQQNLSHNKSNNHFGTITLTVSILAIASLAVYGIGSVIKKKNKSSRLK